MTVTFENDNDVIIYALEKVISYVRRTQQIFVAQCVWWLASIIGLDTGLVNYIDNIQSRINVTITPEEIPSVGETVLPIPRDNPEDLRQDNIFKECEEYLKDSRRLREIATLKATGKTLTGLIYPMAISKKHLRKKDRNKRKLAVLPAELPKKVVSKTAGIDQAEISRLRETGECLQCAWPEDRKGSHQVADCRRPIKLDKGRASFPKAKGHSKIQQAPQLFPDEKESSESSSCEGSSDDSL
jgi:hypothetical protein